ncbi:MAG: flagellar biosynthesis protein FliQ [Alphaproteobacteria bacterium]|nr:flagellar biosynthesis protein FliQ [Alphaproteobacteria bacterium]
MLPGEVGDLLRETVFLILKLSSPLLLTGLVVGVVISLVQALIQVQEQTLTFVPKLFAIFACLILCMGFMANTLMRFTEHLFVMITKLG